MIPSNNFSVLPIYPGPQFQDFRKWWVYGRKYPLFVSQYNFIPFQFSRPTEQVELPVYDSLNNGYIDENGNVLTFGTDEGTILIRYEVTGETEIMLENIPPVVDSSRNRTGIFLDGNGNILGDPFLLSQDGPTTATISVPDEAETAWVQVFSPGYSRGRVLGYAAIRRISQVQVRDANDIVVINDISASLDFRYKRIDGRDYIICLGMSGRTLPIGQYYLRLYDGAHYYYSDFVTITEADDMSEYLKIEWWDFEDFVMDAGRIVYDLGGGEIYHNILYLQAEVAKPEYTFEDEVEKRDGYDFATKQISAKTYRFSFLAPEYLLDAMRFVRMADRIVITNAEQEYIPSAFLITPSWEKEGDIAGVEAQFQTDTVAKKIGLAYVRP